MADLDNRAVAKAYARWAPVYDLVFGAVFDRGRRAAIDAAQRLGGRILEVGVGTGISLPDYDRGVRLVGVDLSEPMLRKARARVATEALAHVEGLAVMDAQRLGFRDGAFEHSFAPVARKLGWRAEFPWRRLERWAGGHGGVTLVERRDMPPLGHFSLIRFSRNGGGRGGDGDGRRRGQPR